MRLGLSIMIMLVGFIATMGIHAAESTTGSNGNLTISDNVTANQLSNTTMPSMTSDVEIKKQVTDFLANAVPLFKQQRTETLQQIRDCQEQKQNSSPENMAQINAQCKMKLDDIKAKYKEQRAELQSLIKNHRNIAISMMSSQMTQIYSETGLEPQIMKTKTSPPTEKPKPQQPTKPMQPKKTMPTEKPKSPPTKNTSS